MLFRLALTLVMVLTSTATTVSAFSLTGFPDQSEIDAGLVRRWAEYVDNPGQPFVLTYAIDYDFLINEDPETAAAAISAIEAALQSWSDATRGLVQFEPAEWGAVRNVGNQPPGQFVGPPQAEADACQDLCEVACCVDPNNCTFQEQLSCVAPCFQANCDSAGWGAHIDFFSEPTGYMVSTGGVNYVMQGCNLGFTAVHRIGSNKIVSADIYLNSDWNWTTDAGAANPARSDDQAGPHQEDLEFAHLTCGCSAQGHAGSVDRAACSNEHNTLTIDLQTVLVHEIGHALGLDHPDEAPAGGNFDPYVFSSTTPNPFAVMDSDYGGVKRKLIADDVGGMAFLYPPELYGDVNADGVIGFVDAFAALDIFEGRVPKDPWTVNRLDYNARNGKIDMDELQQLLLWIIDPSSHPPGEVPSQNPALWQSGSLRASSITIDGGTMPYDIGVGGVVRLGVTIENPEQRIVQGWDIRIQFDSDILLNPRYGTARDFLTGSALIPMIVTPLGPGLSELRIGSLGFDSDNAQVGLLATVEFDVDLAAAAAVSHVDFLFNTGTSEIVVADPYSHSFSLDPNFTDETLTYVPIQADAYLLDLDGNNKVDINDLYQYTINPEDVNYDGVTGCNGLICDRDVLTAILRMDEMADVAGDRQSGGMLPSSIPRTQSTGEATGRRSLND